MLLFALIECVFTLFFTQITDKKKINIFLSTLQYPQRGIFIHNNNQLDTAFSKWFWLDKQTGKISEPIFADSLGVDKGKIWAHRKGRKYEIHKLPTKQSATLMPKYQVFEKEGLKGITSDLQVFISPYFDEIILRDNYFLFRENLIWGLADYAGKQLYYQLSRQPDTIAQALVFEENKKYGLLGSRGQLLLRAVCDSIKATSKKEYAKAFQNGKFIYIYLENSSLLEFKPYAFEPYDLPDEVGLVRFAQKGKVGAALWSGQVSIFPHYTYLSTTQNGLIIFSLRDLYGLMNTAEQVLVQPSFERIGRFYGEYAPAKQSGRWGLIDKNGQWALRNEYDTIIISQSNNWIVSVNQKKGFWTKELNGGAPPIFDGIEDLGQNRLLVFRQGKYDLKTYRNENLLTDFEVFKSFDGCAFFGNFLQD